MEENKVFLMMSGYKVPFTMIKRGIRGILVQGRRGFEERYLVKSDTGVLLDSQKEYVFDTGVEHSYQILQINEANGALVYVIGRASLDVIEAEVVKGEDK